MNLFTGYILILVLCALDTICGQQQYGPPQAQQASQQQQYGAPPRQESQQEQYLPPSQPQQQSQQQQYLPPSQPQQQPRQQQYGAPSQQQQYRAPSQPQQQSKEYLPPSQPRQQSQQQEYGAPSQQQSKQQQYGAPAQQVSQERNLRRRRPIGADNESTMRIVTTLCTPGTLNADVVNRFFACYSKVEGTDIYLKCQHEAYGCILNTERTITSTCQGMGKFKIYMDCLQAEFKKSSFDLVSSATKLNICMADELNVE